MIRNFAIIFNAIFWLELQGALIAAKIFHIYDFDGIVILSPLVLLLIGSKILEKK